MGHTTQSGQHQWQSRGIHAAVTRPVSPQSLLCSTQYCTTKKSFQVNRQAETTVRRSQRDSFATNNHSCRQISATECSHPLTSVPLTLTTILTGNGDMPWAVLISGTAERPCSDDVCVSMLCRLFVSVEDNSESNFCLSEAIIELFSSTSNTQLKMRTTTYLGRESAVGFPL